MPNPPIAMGHYGMAGYKTYVIRTEMDRKNYGPTSPGS